MELYLPSLKTFVYTASKYGERHNNIMCMMEKLRFNNWEFVFGGEGPNRYWSYMHDDWIELLKTPVPFVIMEDDATLIPENYRSVVNYPSEANIVYLGGTCHGNQHDNLDINHPDPNLLTICTGGLGVYKHGRMMFEEYNDEYIKVYNMYSTHSVLFTDGNFCKYLSTEISCNKDSPIDVILAYRLYKFMALCIKNPFWYQMDGNNDEPTQTYY